MKVQDSEAVCGVCLDELGDHVVMCNVGAFVSVRHSCVNDVILQAGREAGYAALSEQVIHEFGRYNCKRGYETFEEGRVDVELFGHPCSPDRFIDGTVWHPAANHIVKKAARESGICAAHAVKKKCERYPTRNGKAITACALETWGWIDPGFDNFLAELDVLASQRQKNRGVFPIKWRTR